MSIIWFILAGIVGGLLGGLGMGGGTLLIPMLTLWLDVPQQSAQLINLCAFVPMSVAALIVHIKNGFVAYKKLLYIIVPAILGAVLGAISATKVDSDMLSKLFGVFLVVLGGVSVFAYSLGEKN